MENKLVETLEKTIETIAGYIDQPAHSSGKVTSDDALKFTQAIMNTAGAIDRIETAQRGRLEDRILKVQHDVA